MIWTLKIPVLLVFAEPAWHLIIGGSYATKLVELYNWQTGQICQLSNLPFDLEQTSGTVLDGIPIFCGNFNYGQGDTNCSQLNKDDLTWERVSPTEIQSQYFANFVKWLISQFWSDCTFYNGLIIDFKVVNKCKYNKQYICL